MAEIASCEITVYEGQQVKKGADLGSFHYGGSSYCIIFQKKVPLIFEHKSDPNEIVLVNDTIATVNTTYSV